MEKKNDKRLNDIPDPALLSHLQGIWTLTLHAGDNNM
jgi:hypothetical protein